VARDIILDIIHVNTVLMSVYHYTVYAPNLFSTLSRATRAAASAPCCNDIAPMIA